MNNYVSKLFVCAAAIAIIAPLVSCSSGGADVSASSDTAATCDPSSPVDNAICDDLVETYGDDNVPDSDCDLVDGTNVFTPAFAEVADRRAHLRCLVTDDAGLIAAAQDHGLEIDGIADLGEEGDVDYNIFYLAWKPCHIEPTFWPATSNWSIYKGTSPSLTNERFETAEEAVSAALAKCN